MRVTEIGRLTPQQKAKVSSIDAAENEIRKAPLFGRKWREWERFKRILIVLVTGSVLMFGFVWFITY